MATSLLVTPETKVASLVKLATESHGIPVTAAFWLRLPDADYPSIALVIPLADKVGAREVYGRVMSALANETVAPKSFLQSRLAVFGERESKEALHALRDRLSLVSKIDHYRNVEIEEIPAAADICMNGELSFIPDDSSEGANILCTVVFADFGRSGACPYVRRQGPPQLNNIFDAFRIPASDRERIVASLKEGRGYPRLVFDVGLDTLYRVGLH